MWGLKTKPLTSDQEQLLRSQEITADAPGAVLHDFDVLLHFVGINGIQTSGALRLLPLAALAELNSAMREPLRLDLNRAQLRSYPNLSALHILGRASGLLMPQGSGSEMRLAVDPELLAQWVDFNPVERYCTLLEVWLLHGQPEIIGHCGGMGNCLLRAIEVWSRIPKGGKKYSATQRGSADGYKDIDWDRYNLGFLWLFGLVEVLQRAPLPKKTWCPAGVGRTPFGDALLTVLANAGMPRINEDGVFEIPFSGDGDEDEELESDGTTEEPVSLDELQPALSPYFPAWRKTLTIPPPEFRDGVYVFKVAVGPGKVWRRLAMPADTGWHDFADGILRAFKFDDDHLWAFTLTDRFGAKLEITRGEPSAASFSGDEVAIGGVPLRPGEPFEFLYDFGDSWKFAIVLERIDPTDPRLKRAKVIESHGKAPKQYEDDWE